jgi:hypothetical protein
MEMESDKIMLTEEVIEEAAQEISKAGFGAGFKVAAGVGLVLIVGGIVYIGGIAYKYVIKPKLAKFKSKKNPNAIDKVVRNFHVVENAEESENNE